MYKLLIVEDEKWEREGLRAFLNWKDMGVELVGCACNGVEGIKMAQEYQPDIILTDVIMPKIDGIEMSRNIRAFLPDAVILVISGYDEFEYAKQSFDFNAFAYLLKPIQKKEFEDIIKKAVETLDHKKKNKKEKILLEDQWKNYIYTGQDRIFIDFLEGKIELKSILGYLPTDKIKVSGRKVVVVLSLYTDFDKSSFEDSSWENLRQETLKIIDHMLGDRGIGAFNNELRKELVICLEAPSSTEQLERALSQIVDKLDKKLGIKSIAGIGQVVDNLKLAPKSYLQAREAIGFGFLANFGELLFYDDIINKNCDRSSIPSQLFEKSNLLSKKIAHSIQKANMQECSELVDEFIILLRKDMSRSKILLNCFLMDIVNELNMLSLYNSYKNAYTDLSVLNSLSQTKKYIIDFINSLASNIKTVYSKDKIVQQILKIVEERYYEELDLKSISKEIHLSPYYIGSIFKDYTGKNFNQYLNDYRMNKAKEMLLSKNIKVSYLAEKVGIPNTSYFCSLFKDKFGISPGKFKKIKNRGHNHV